MGDPLEGADGEDVAMAIMESLIADEVASLDWEHVVVVDDPSMDLTMVWGPFVDPVEAAVFAAGLDDGDPSGVLDADPAAPAPRLVIVAGQAVDTAGTDPLVCNYATRGDPQERPGGPGTQAAR